MKSTTDNNVAMLNERYFLKCLDFAQNPIVIWGEKTEMCIRDSDQTACKISKGVASPLLYDLP